MQLNWNPYLRPASPNTTPTAEQTLTVMDLPRLYVEMYGVHNIEFQHSNIVQSETDPAFVKELKAALDAHNVKMTQINLEFGTVQAISNAEAANRQAAVDHVKQWIDIAAGYGCPRVMINQQQAQLNKEVRAGAVAAFKAMADYGRPKQVKVSVETRGAGTPELIQNLGMKPWEFMAGIIEEAGAASNVDIGNVGAMNQLELHDCIRRWLPTSSGNMHIKSSPFWDIGRGRAVHRVPRLQGALFDRSQYAPSHAHRLQHDSREPRVGVFFVRRVGVLGLSGTRRRRQHDPAAAAYGDAALIDGNINRLRRQATIGR